MNSSWNSNSAVFNELAAEIDEVSNEKIRQWEEGLEESKRKRLVKDFENTVVRLKLFAEDSTEEEPIDKYEYQGIVCCDKRNKQLATHCFSVCLKDIEGDIFNKCKKIRRNNVVLSVWIDEKGRHHLDVIDSKDNPYEESYCERKHKGLQGSFMCNFSGYLERFNPAVYADTVLEKRMAIESSDIDTVNPCYFHMDDILMRYTSEECRRKHGFSERSIERLMYGIEELPEGTPFLFYAALKQTGKYPNLRVPGFSDSDSNFSGSGGSLAAIEDRK